MNLDGLDAHWAEDLYVNYSYVQAGYFPDFGTRTLDLEQIQQWKYTTADGTTVLLALDQTGKGIILAEQEGGSIFIDVDSNLGGPNFPEPEAVMDQSGLEYLADIFDYSIQPQSVDVESLQQQLDADQEVQNQKMRDAVQTYSGFTEYLLEERSSVRSAGVCVLRFRWRRCGGNDHLVRDSQRNHFSGYRPGRSP